MALFDYLKNKLFQAARAETSHATSLREPSHFRATRSDVAPTPPSETTAKRGSLSSALRRTYLYRAELEMKELRMSILAAEDAFRPRRFYLLKLYHEVVRDLHLAAQLRVAHITVQRAPWQLVETLHATSARAKTDPTTDPNSPAAMAAEEALEQDATALKHPWFSRYLRHALDAEFYGHSLIEFNPKRDDDGHFTEVTLIAREHVRPETGEVVIEVNHERGIPFREGPLAKNLIEIGDSDDFGILLIASKAIIRKNAAEVDWARKSEKFGLPFVALKTDTRQQADLDEKARMLENMGSNNWAIFGDADELEFLESKNGENGHKLFADRITMCDDAISKLINGQTSTSDQKAFTGSAEVHERLLNDFTFARLYKLQEDINYKLLPFLVANGYTELEGKEFQFTELQPKEITPEDDTTEPNGTGGTAQGANKNLPKAQQKKKPLTKPLTNALLQAHYDLYHNDCC